MDNLQTAVENLMELAGAIESAKGVDLVHINNAPGGLYQTRKFILRHIATNPMPGVDACKIGELLSTNQPIAEFPDNLRKAVYLLTQHQNAPKAANAPRRNCTLFQFIKNNCVLPVGCDIRSKVDRLNKANRDGDIELPDTAAPWTSGGTKVFFENDLRNRWPDYTKIIPSLADYPLKAQNSEE